MTKQEQPDYYEWAKPPHILLYIDNSNIFESAKIYSGRKKGYMNGIPDVACRIDVGKLVDRAVGDRGVLFGKLYGSEPPALDSVWDAIRRKKVHVETFQRSKWTMKEKQTDAALTAGAIEDIVDQKNEIGPNRTVILFSGDRDLLSVVNTAVKHGYKAEVWSFAIAFNNTVKRLAQKNPDQVKVFAIDNIFNEITYTKVVWGKEQIPRERSLITSILLPTDRDKKGFLKEFVSEAGRIFHLPMMGKYLSRYKYILLLPCIKEYRRTKTGKIRNFDYYKHVQPFTHQLDEHYSRLGLKIKLQAYKVFLDSRRSTNGPEDITSENRFQNLTLYGNGGNETEDEEEDDDVVSEYFSCYDHDVASEFFDCDDEDLLGSLEVEEDHGKENISNGADNDGVDGDDGFVPLIRKITKPTRMYSEPCLNKFWCSKYKCPYVHTNEEKEFFKLQPDLKLRRLYKLKACFHQSCRYQDKPYLCGYAHSLEESRCLCCKQQGNGKHWMDKCPMKGSN